MRALRVSLVVTALVLLPCAAARAVQSEGTSLTGTDTDTDVDTNSTRNYKSLFTQIAEMVKHEEEDGELAQSTGKKEHPRPQLRTKNGEQILEVFPRDVQKKEKFLKHLTGPLYFSPKCRKHVYRLYHNTRDCTIPAYYKRCARLLTRLAGSPRCLQS